MKNKHIAIGLGLAMAFFSTYYNYAYFVADTYQDNIITIKAKEAEKEPKYNFITTAQFNDDTFTGIDIKLQNYFDVDMSFGFEIVGKYGVFKDKRSLYMNNPTENEVSISFLSYIDINKISTSLPSEDKLDVVINYTKDNQKLKKYYTVEFTREPIGDNPNLYHSENLVAYFNEKD